MELTYNNPEIGPGTFTGVPKSEHEYVSPGFLEWYVDRFCYYNPEYTKAEAIRLLTSNLNWEI